ncbi:MAG: DASS family sodium-coupled anion symporter [Nitrospirae bacterium]|nr:DASS family sodium-coupled anion symporter [Nitrospirota bacterium]
MPAPALSGQGHSLAAILSLVITYWVSEAIPIPVTALLGAALCVFMGVAPARTVLAPFADPIVFLFIGSFIIAKAMNIHRLDRRFAMYIFSIKGIGNSPSMLLIACGVVVALISMWISNTAATAIMLPICIGIISSMEKRLSTVSFKYRAGMMLMIAYGASVGGIGTPVGSPPNLIAIGMIESLAHYRITFFQWMALGVPMLIIMFIVLSILLLFLHNPPSRTDSSALIIQDTEDDAAGWSKGEIYTLISFGTAVMLWILPGIIAVVYGVDSGLYKSLKGVLDEGVVAVVAAFLLFVLPVNWQKRTFAISWDQAVRIDWGTILLFGGGLSLGKLMFDTGLANIIGNRLTNIAGVEGLWSITALSVIIGILVSEATSNTASASMVIPVMIAIAQAAGVSPVPPALGACLGASFGFMLPVSTPPNAIVYGSGMVPILSMLKAGVIFDALGFVTIWTGLRILCPLLGLM